MEVGMIIRQKKAPLVERWGRGFGGLRGLKWIFGGLAATFPDKNGLNPPPAVRSSDYDFRL
jgi:hypothetical protein